MSPLHSRMLYAKFGWNCPRGVLRKKIFKIIKLLMYLSLKHRVTLYLNIWTNLISLYSNFVNVISLFRNCHPLGKGVFLHLNTLKSPIPYNSLCHVWLKFAKWFLENIFCISLIHVYFHYFVIISFWKKTRTFIWTDLNSLYPRMLYTKFG